MQHIFTIHPRTLSHYEGSDREREGEKKEKKKLQEVWSIDLLSAVSAWMNGWSGSAIAPPAILWSKQAIQS